MTNISDAKKTVYAKIINRGQHRVDIVWRILKLTRQRAAPGPGAKSDIYGYTVSLLFLYLTGEEWAGCMIVSGGSSDAILPLLGNFTAAAAGRQGVAIFGRCGGARASQLLTSDTWRTEMTLLISPFDRDADCGRQLQVNIGELSAAFARWRVGTVHVVVERADLESGDAGAWPRGAGAWLRRYAATLEAVVRHDVATRVVVHADVIVTSVGGTRDVTSLCRDPFGGASRDFADVILSTVYSFTDVYRNLYNLTHVYSVLYVS